ncbi:MAG: NACHT domain-containing protein [Spirulina sp. SIO3F2]|nr:NACHT domain-containing protein [Spirulina sp. SIO3F2]
MEALKGKTGDYQHQCIPVFLELKRFDSNEVSIQQRIVAEFETCGFPEPEKFTAKALEQGKLLVLFDGLDEVPGQYVNGVIDQIQDFVDRCDQNRFIASCRTAAYRSGFRRFKDVVMADFDDQQIQQYIENWFSSEPDKEAETAKYCWELLQREDQQGAKELAQTPLLLTFLCLVYDRSQSFSSNRSALYRKALRILLEEWAAEKRINRDKIYEGLHIELEEILLSEIAYRNFLEDKLFFEKPDLVDQIRDFLESNLNADQTLDAESVLDAMAVQQGIFVERAEDVYSFSHLTLQEYLTAQYIVDDDCIDAIVEQCLLNKTWKEVFLLIASAIRAKGADRFLLKMIEQIEKLLEQPIYREKLIPILLWAEAETKDAGGNLSLLARRSVANKYAQVCAQAYTRIYNEFYGNYMINEIASVFVDAVASARAYILCDILDNVSVKAFECLIDFYQKIAIQEPIFTNLDILDLIEYLKKSKDKNLGNKPDGNTKSTFSNQLKKIIFEAHNFPEQLAKLSNEEVKIINNYYYATYLLIQCKEAAVRVSPETWAAIEERMLRVPKRLRE